MKATGEWRTFPNRHTTSLPTQKRFHCLLKEGKKYLPNEQAEAMEKGKGKGTEKEDEVRLVVFGTVNAIKRVHSLRERERLRE